MASKSFTVRPFERLRKTIERHAASNELQPPRKKKKEEHTEDELFTSAMGDVNVIEAFRALSCERSDNGKANPVAKRHDPELEAREILTAIAEGTMPINLADTPEYVEWTNPDYASLIKEHLQEGRFSVQAFLDLHGCTVPEAEEELDAFLHDAFTKALRCVKIIHGRGLRSIKGPRIKQAVIRRLLGRYRKDIIAYTSARQCDGGLGALYVLLIRK